MILRLERQEGCIRVKNLARELGLRKGSVSGALKTLRERGLVDYRPYQPIRLTEAGREMAEKIAGHHCIIACFLRKTLRMSPKTAEMSAARMGSVVDEAVVARMRHYLERSPTEVL
jgi:DtxR family Mn-dependent transcriptional regulator